MAGYLEGIISVRAALEGRCREVEKIYIDIEKYRKRDRRVTGFLSYVKAIGTEYELCGRDRIEELLSSENAEGVGKTHGGVIARIGDRSYLEVEELLDKCKRENGYCIYLDGIEDPFNLGYSYRALYASGASGIILPYRYRDNAANVLARSSAGASELMTTALFKEPDSENARLELVRKIKERGITLCCAALQAGSVSLFEYGDGFPMILFIGGEKRGISPEFVENADRVLHIPYAGQNIRYSLPTATVAALSGFHLFNLRSKFLDDGNL